MASPKPKRPRFSVLSHHSLLQTHSSVSISMSYGTQNGTQYQFERDNEIQRNRLITRKSLCNGLELGVGEKLIREGQLMKEKRNRALE